MVKPYHLPHLQFPPRLASLSACLPAHTTHLTHVRWVGVLSLPPSLRVLPAPGAFLLREMGKKERVLQREVSGFSFFALGLRVLCVRACAGGGVELLELLR
ncbi:hypothetical protein GW17_00025991 [Ensete ventricosum]|nr:hypothetical protein GW17_00025991 [Ensete ventricosum]RZR83214.1 hypothetical protein BHM03_00009803 [Ensete ventricosum]